jgi:hypothetical protein
MATTLWGREPAIVLGLVGAALALAVGFGAPITTIQAGLILAFSQAVVAVVTRRFVSPVARKEPPA